MATEVGLDTEIRDLYRLAPEEFVAARNALAARLGQEKRKDQAAAVKALTKPTPSAWAVNALFAREGRKMEALIAAGRRARDVQRDAASGRGAESLREDLRLARGLADELRWDAAQILAERGRPPGRDLVERIAGNLQAIAWSPAAADEAARGWLDRDLDPPGFEVMAGLQLAAQPAGDAADRRLPPKPAEKETGKEEAERARRIAQAEEKVERARARAAPLREEASRLAAEAAEARRAADEAERAAARAREKADRAGKDLAEAEEALREARAAK
ncbi:MAG TPA: hypothetical protein VN783_11610 [Thermoanaerobaculia bacterium]|nr:hypothetical protein [Thermoanaerobaculia bacterium]